MGRTGRVATKTEEFYPQITPMNADWKTEDRGRRTDKTAVTDHLILLASDPSGLCLLSSVL
jgi:hypothetical protein